jgi:glycerol-3-phosphate dehydrogenase
MGGPWTASAPLPGGDIAFSAIADEIDRLQARYSFLKPANVQRLFRAYGTDVEAILGDARFAADLGRWFGPLCEREISHLKTREFAVTADDILWRRSKLGLHMREDEIEALRDYLEGNARSKAALRAKPAKKSKTKAQRR